MTNSSKRSAVRIAQQRAVLRFELYRGIETHRGTERDGDRRPGVGNQHRWRVWIQWMGTSAIDLLYGLERGTRAKPDDGDNYRDRFQHDELYARLQRSVLRAVANGFSNCRFVQRDDNRPDELHGIHPGQL